MSDELIEPASWIASKPAGASMEDLWSELLHESWELSFDEAMFYAESIDLTSLVRWALVNVPELRVDLSSTLESALGAALASSKIEKAFKSLVPEQQVSDLLDRVNSIALDRGLNIVDVLAELKAGNHIIGLVQKNATKSIKYEKTAAAFIESRVPHTKVFALAAAESKLTIRFSNSGTIQINGAATKAMSKSADLVAILTDRDPQPCFLLSHKFARTEGGHQKNQENDAETFLRNSSLFRQQTRSDIPQLETLLSSLLGRTMKIAWEPGLLLDGAYFTQPARVASLQAVNSKSFVGSTDDFVEYLKKI